ncbi:25880_t:CDS:1, partial [Racocetra persica]
RGLVGEFGSEVGKDSMVVIMEALLDVVVKIDAMIKGLLLSLMSIKYDSNEVNNESSESNACTRSNDENLLVSE